MRYKGIHKENREQVLQSLILNSASHARGLLDTKTRPLYMLSTRDPPQNRGHIQTESEGLEKDIPHK